LFAAGMASAQEDFQGVLQLIDERSNFQDDLSATVLLETTDPEEGNDSRHAKMFRRDGDDLFLILIEKPETQLGQGYLNIQDGLWFYDPESRQFTFTSLSESFEGSDANNDDFEASSLAEDYRVVSSSEGTLGNFEVWVLELEATDDEVTYPYKKIWITKDESLLLKSEDYSLTERLLRTSYYPSYARAGDSYIADQMIFVDELVAGKSTRITLPDISTATIPDSVFTKAYVERVNR
jgi:outer membrane lipoprotein-sorting protein